jgi:ABC-type transport system involved in multi-copper enzyme maturation permease subunit
MVSIDSTKKPICPVCHKADAVKTLQAAYDEGITRFAPPPMPTKTVPVLKYMIFSVLIVAVCVFAIIIFVGSESFGQSFSIPELLLVLLTLVCIVAVLGLSFVVFNKLVQGDDEASKRYPEWDRAVENWGRLRYCSRDDIVFDPQTGKVVSEEALSSLLGTSVEQEKQKSQTSTSPGSLISSNKH